MKMEKGFWQERWEQNEIGFHQNEIHRDLRQHWQELQLADDTEVFVPLCGKSHDLVWLREQGHTVLGVELSVIAVQAFFRENGFIPQQVTSKNFEYYEAEGIRILCGDFFDLAKSDLASTDAVYDRASLVALPSEMRGRYAHHLVSILPAGTQILLITFDYPQAQMAGPPFAVSVNEVESLYRDDAVIQLLAQRDVLTQFPNFQERGLSRLRENTFLLTIKGDGAN
jgi:thiopurine S-methyltransferase